MDSMRIRLSDERRARLERSLQAWFAEQLEQELGVLGARLLLDFMVKELGPPVLNQAMGDARAWMAERLEDLEGEFYEPEQPRSY